MSDRRFYQLLTLVLAVCVVLTAAHLVWAIDAYGHCSIIYFIGKELW